MDDGFGKPWHLFSSEDMLKGNKPKKPRKPRRLLNANKENMSNTVNGSPSTSPLSAQSILLNTPGSYANNSISTAIHNGSTRSMFSSPLSDITNQRSSTLPRKQRRKLQSPVAVDDSQSSFFEDRLNQTVFPNVDNVDAFDDQLETSIIEDDRIHDGSDDSNDEFCVEEPWGEDYDIDSDKDDTNTAIPHFGTRRRLRSVYPDEYCTLGSPTAICGKCNARMWKEERVKKNISKGTPIFSICCKRGEVKLPPTPATPPYLQIIYNDPLKSIAFLRNIGIYNAMFSFTSAGGNVDHSINNGRGPYIYRLNGQNHHVFGSLIPDDGETPKFCQLYIYDTANEMNNRLCWVNSSDKTQVHAEVVEGLLQMLDQTNELCKEFRMARDRFENNDLVDLKVELKVCRSQSGRENHISASDDVAGVMVGSSDNTTCDRDIIIEPKMGRLRRVSYVHPKFMALQYPILFPNGEDGYHDKIPFTSADPNNLKDHDMISMKNYYSYRFQVRDHEGMTPRLGGRLYRQYIVDAFSAIEQTRLWWFRINQTILRNELYSHICDSVRSGDSSTSNVGKGVILPSGFVGSKRYMQQNFQDALAVCRHFGHPDIFLTMTTNPLWDEIQRWNSFQVVTIATPLTLSLEYSVSSWIS
ncbi:uncharacterized protein LOC141697880 [Apium graveolens]|uniref:uncharacterized protein LOC141697880 n=1 Tax=Apium graveolens TaxID=4045 RepID=UPI003D79B6E4